MSSRKKEPKSQKLVVSKKILHQAKLRVKLMKLRVNLRMKLSVKLRVNP